MELNGITNPFNLMSDTRKKEDVECLRPLITFTGQCQEALEVVQKEKKDAYINLIKKVMHMPIDLATSYKNWNAGEIQDLKFDLWLVAASISVLVLTLKGADYSWNQDCTSSVYRNCRRDNMETTGICMTFAAWAAVSSIYYVYNVLRNHLVKESTDQIILDYSALKILNKKESDFRNLQNYANLKIACLKELHPEVVDIVRQKYFELIQKENEVALIK
jgi:hypothetical protein